MDRGRHRRPLDGLDEDIRDHIERETQENIERGMTPEEARRQAMLAFGNVALAKEDARRVWVWAWLDEARQDLRYAARSTPVLAIMSVRSSAGVARRTAGKPGPKATIFTV